MSSADYFEAGTAGEAAEKARASAAQARSVSVHIIRSATWEPISDWLVAEAATSRLLVSLSFGSYARVGLQVESYTTASNQPDLLLLVPDLAELSPSAASDPSSADTWPNEAAHALATLCERTRSRLPASTKLLAVTPWCPIQGSGLTTDNVRNSHQRFVAQSRELIAQAGSADGVLDAQAAIDAAGSARAFDQRLWQSSRVPLSALGMAAMARLWARAIGAALLPRSKVLVLDCDNTLWGGILGELGENGISLAPDGTGAGYYRLQQEALALSRRGVLLALASKNDQAQVLDVLSKHPHMLLRPERIAAHSIGWHNKADGLRRIAETLGLAIESLVFVDDNEHECELIRQQLPTVAVYRLPASAHRLAGFVSGLREFDALRVTAADQTRTQEYQARAQRQIALTQTGDSRPFLETLGLCAIITEATSGDLLERVAQMEAKTSQFNTTTPRLSRQQLQAVIAQGGSVLALSLRDRLSDSGVTGSAVVSLNGATATVESFLLSCRIIGMGAEHALMCALGEWAKTRGCTTLRGRIVETERNSPARSLYRDSGFEINPDGTWGRSVNGMSDLWPAWIARGTP